MILNEPFLAISDVLGVPSLFAEQIGGINDFFLRSYGEGLSYCRDHAPKQSAGRKDAQNEDDQTFGIFHDEIHYRSEEPAGQQERFVFRDSFFVLCAYHSAVIITPVILGK